MKKKWIAMAAVLAALGAGSAGASSPLPVFDKEAVTTHPYNRTGEEYAKLPAAETSLSGYRPGNTGTEEAPAFYVKKIELEGESIPDADGELASVIAAYEGRSVEAAELDTLLARITECYRKGGYTVAQAILPKQEVEGGLLRIHVYAAHYDSVGITKNTSDVATSLLESYLHKLHAGDAIKDRRLEMALNNLNDMPAVRARAVLRPGSTPGTTAVDIEAERRPVWNNYVFTDNGGGYYSGRWRTGFYTEINNLAHSADKIAVHGMTTSHDTDNYGIRYEIPVGPNGTRLGVAWSRSTYDLNTNPLYGSLGESKGWSLYGTTPLFRDKTDRVTAIYGYDRRDITDRILFNKALSGLLPNLRMEKQASVWHAGITGSQYNKNQFIQYSAIYWYGSMKGDSGKYHYQKLTADLLDVIYDGDWNYRLKFSGQLASRGIDGSEQFYLGGMHGIRAYGASDGYGDYGYVATGEIRRKTGIKGLEAALFIDNGVAVQKEGGRMDHLSGWGAGLRYAKENDWYAQLDAAWKIDGRKDRTEPNDHGQRIWFQLYKMF